MTKTHKLRRYKKKTTATYYYLKRVIKGQNYHFATLDGLALM